MDASTAPVSRPLHAAVDAAVDAPVKTPGGAPATAPAPTVAPEREIDRDFDRELLRRRYPPHKVVVHDNDHTPFDSVWKILLKAVPGMSFFRAYTLTLEIHTTGAAVPYVGPKERAEAVAGIIRTIDIKVTVEPDC